MNTDSITARLISAIKAPGLTLKKFSDRSGIPYPSLTEYGNGKRNPGMDALASILKVSGVSADWLFLGKGDMYGVHTEEKIDSDLLVSIGLQLKMSLSQSGLDATDLGLIIRLSATIYDMAKGLSTGENRTNWALDRAVEIAGALKKSGFHPTSRKHPRVHISAEEIIAATSAERPEQLDDVGVTKGDD